jgi:hypothetical protein
LYSKYIFTLSKFVGKNTDAFKWNSAVHSVNTTEGFHLQPPKTNLTEAEKWVYYLGVTIFGNLPLNIRHSSLDTNKFKFALKFLSGGSFYCCGEHFGWNLGAIRVLSWSLFASWLLKKTDGYETYEQIFNFINYSNYDYYAYFTLNQIVSNKHTDTHISVYIYIPRCYNEYRYYYADTYVHIY